MQLAKLKKAYFASAKILDKLGSDYLIFFERIHKELMEVEKKQDLTTIALKVARTNVC